MPQNHRGLFFLAMNTSDCGYKVLALFNEKYEQGERREGGGRGRGREGREREGREGEGGLLEIH